MRAICAAPLFLALAFAGPARAGEVTPDELLALDSDALSQALDQASWGWEEKFSAEQLIALAGTLSTAKSAKANGSNHRYEVARIFEQREVAGICPGVDGISPTLGGWGRRLHRQFGRNIAREQSAPAGAFVPLKGYEGRNIPFTVIGNATEVLDLGEIRLEPASN